MSNEQSFRNIQARSKLNIWFSDILAEIMADRLEKSRSLWLMHREYLSFSTFYVAVDDIWIVSKSLSFDRHSTFVAKSVFYGPSSNGELQIAPIRSVNMR